MNLTKTTVNDLHPNTARRVDTSGLQGNTPVFLAYTPSGKLKGTAVAQHVRFNGNYTIEVQFDDKTSQPVQAEMSNLIKSELAHHKKAIRFS